MKVWNKIKSWWLAFTLWVDGLINHVEEFPEMDDGVTVTSPTVQDEFNIFPPRTTNRKVRDTTKIKQWQANIVIERHAQFINRNKGMPRSLRETTEDLTNQLNEELGLDKGRTFYSYIWNGRTPLESFPKN